MCGLLGQLSLSRAGDEASAAADAEAIAQFGALLSRSARRGPDDSGLWRDGSLCWLGFRRLSILDPSAAAHQPMTTADGRFTLVYNGALYNFPELRRELEGGGVCFRSNGDAEVVLYALANWGAAALARFNGMFALGFYDRRERRLLLARDHAGMKPLYYMRTGRGLIFASQYDQILQHPWAQAVGYSADALGLFLRLGYIPAPHALLRDSHLLDAGTWLSADADGRVERGRFFEFAAERQPDLRGAAADEAVAATVEAAVRRHLLADVPVGTFLSGGVDAPLVTATARAVSVRPLPAFTLGSDADLLDESTDAAVYARELGVEHVVKTLAASAVVELLDDVVAACSEPFADYSIFPTLAVSKLASSRVRVVLSGDGGDELFWGYAGRFGALLQRLEAAGRRDGRESGWSLPRLLSAGRGQDDARWPTSVGDLHRTSHTHATEGWLRRLFPDLPAWPQEFALFRYDGWDVDRTAQWLRWNEFNGHLGMVLQKVDRAGMFHSLEVRSPLLDREVIEVAGRIDWRSCLDPDKRVGKLPLRRALARRVTHQPLLKRGFAVPMDEWLRGPLRSIFESAVLTRDGVLGMPFDRRVAAELFARHVARQTDAAWLLWLLLSLVLWGQRYGRA